MKDKVIVLIIGILIGAIVASAGFLIYNKVTSNNSNQTEMMQMNGPSSKGNMGKPPAKPEGDNGEEPPTRPEDNANSNS